METETPSIGSSVISFTLAFIVLAILVNLILWVLINYAGMSPESGRALGWMPLVLGAMQAGQSYGKKAGGKPAASYSWTATLIFTAITFVLLALGWAAMASVMDMSFGNLLQDMRRDIGATAMYSIFAGFFVLIWVMNRFAFSFGAGQAAKWQAAAKK